MHCLQTKTEANYGALLTDTTYGMDIEMLATEPNIVNYGGSSTRISTSTFAYL